MHRRGFFGWLAGGIASLMGLGKATFVLGQGDRKVGSHSEERLKALIDVPNSLLDHAYPAKWFFEDAPAIWHQYNLTKPNPSQTIEDFVHDVLHQWKTTGLAIVWEISNTLGQVVEVYVIPTKEMVPHPAVLPGYPQGYYRLTRDCSVGELASLNPVLSAERVRRFPAPTR